MRGRCGFGAGAFIHPPVSQCQPPFLTNQLSADYSLRGDKMAADGGLAEGGDDFDPRSGEIESIEKHINSALTAPDQKL